MAQAATKQDIAGLRRQIEALAGGRRPNCQPAPASRLAIGPSPIDAALGGGLTRHALHEAGGPAARAFAAGLAGRLTGPVIWIAHADQAAYIHPYGLHSIGLPPENLLFVAAPPTEVAWAFEQALRAGAAAAVIAEAATLPGFTASRRLQLAAQEGATLALLLAPERRRQRPPTSAADTRWRVAPRPTAGPWGAARYRLELQKNKSGSIGVWEIEWHGPSHRFHLAAAV